MKTAVSKGMAITPRESAAQSRSAPNRRHHFHGRELIGAFISPISDANAVPARPENKSAVNTGPSSFSNAKSGTRAQRFGRPETGEYIVELQPHRHAHDQRTRHDE